MDKGTNSCSYTVPPFTVRRRFSILLSLACVILSSEAGVCRSIRGSAVSMVCCRPFRNERQSGAEAYMSFP